MNIALARSLTYVTFFDPFLPSLQELIQLPDEHLSLIKHSFDFINFELHHWLIVRLLAVIKDPFAKGPPGGIDSPSPHKITMKGGANL